MSLAPVAVFAYRRPDKLMELLNTLSSCREARDTELFIFVDGPRSVQEEGMVAETRAVALGETRFKSVSVTASEINIGLSRAITTGVSQLLANQDRLIVLEDDLLVSPYFLRYMNDGLKAYETTEEVVSIHAYRYPTVDDLPPTFFLRGADCWGWATWRRGWELYNSDSTELLSRLIRSGEMKEFDFNGTHAFSSMLRDQLAGRNDSWAVRWYASAFLANKLTLYPDVPLAVNTGIDGSGTHGKGDSRYQNALSETPVLVSWQAPIESAAARKAFEEFFKETRPSPIKRFIKGIRDFVFPPKLVNH